MIVKKIYKNRVKLMLHLSGVTYYMLTYINILDNFTTKILILVHSCIPYIFETLNNNTKNEFELYITNYKNCYYLLTVAHLITNWNFIQNPLILCLTINLISYSLYMVMLLDKKLNFLCESEEKNILWREKCIDYLPSLETRTQTENETDMTCCICYEDGCLQPDLTFISTKCGCTSHLLCVDCFEKWYIGKDKNTCFTCDRLLNINNFEKICLSTKL